MSATVMVELTSFIGLNAKNEKLSPASFVSHASDLRTSVRYGTEGRLSDGREKAGSCHADAHHRI